MYVEGRVICALSGGVDSAVAAWRLLEAGCEVECLHMTNWEDDGYCDASREFQDARAIADRLGVKLHRVNFSREYYRDVFEDFLLSHRRGETPNPDVLCNRYIKFGVMLRYAQRLGGATLATGHYAQVERDAGTVHLKRAADQAKDQTYFLHSVLTESFQTVQFPLGDLEKPVVRQMARSAGLPVAEKRDSTGICFIGERPFAQFLAEFIEDQPGPIVDEHGNRLGEHRGLAFYTLGQRQGLEIGGLSGLPASPWYVAAKLVASNELVVVQGHDHPLLFQDRVIAEAPNWIGAPPVGLADGHWVQATARSRYRQPDSPCRIRQAAENRIEAHFDTPQRAVTPGQFLVVYQQERCLGGGLIRAAT